MINFNCTFKKSDFEDIGKLLPIYYKQFNTELPTIVEHFNLRFLIIKFMNKKIKNYHSTAYQKRKTVTVSVNINEMTALIKFFEIIHAKIMIEQPYESSLMRIMNDMFIKILSNSEPILFMNEL